jgi:hypothetical protein
MSDYIVVSPFVQPGPVTAVHTAPACAIGLEVDAVDRAAASAGGCAAGRFVYARGSNVASAGQFVQIVNGSAILLASGNVASNYPVGVAAGALSATNVYGWVQVQGKADYCRATNHSFAAGVPLFFASTAGYIGTVSGAASRIIGIVAPVSNASSLSAGGMSFDLNRPYNFAQSASI